MPRSIALFAFLAASALAGCAAPSAGTLPATTAASADPVPAEPPGAPAPRATQASRSRAEDLVEVEAITSNRFVQAAKPGEIEVRVHLRAKLRTGGKRPPINLALVVDTSGSMEGPALEDARAASLALVDALSEGDRLALVVFNSTTEVLMPSTVLDKKSVAEIREKIGAIKARGTTDLAGGLGAGLSEVMKGFRADGINRIVLLGDGVPNDPTPLAGLAESAGQHRVSITTLGLGLDQDETMMSKLALTSGGKYHFLRDSSQVAAVFSDEVLRLTEVVGRGTVVTLTPGPGVVIRDAIGLPLQQQGGGKSSIVLGDMSEGDERDVLLRLSVAGRHAGTVVELCDAEVSMDDPGASGQRISERAFVSARSTDEAAKLAEGRERSVMHAVAKLSVADAIVRAVAAARGGDLKLGRSLLDAAEKEASAAAKAFDDAELAEKAKSIPPLRKSLASLLPPPPPPMRRPGFGPALPPRPIADEHAPTVSPAAPSPAAIVMKSQAAAMRAIQGPSGHAD